MTVLASNLIKREHALISSSAVSRAIGWIERAQDALDCGGVPATYTPLLGWSAAYPETTGYIIPTLLALAKRLDRPELAGRAERMGRWLTSIQLENGAFPGGVWRRGVRNPESIFNSGQILFGLVALWKATRSQHWREAGIRCALWILEHQDADGAWRRHCYRGTFHVYKTRVAWALALAGTHWDDSSMLDGAARNIENAIRHQDATGWFEHAGFNRGAPPVLHTFAYTEQGVLETGMLLGSDAFIASAVASAGAIARAQSLDGSLPGIVDKQFSERRFRCLTGIAQQVVVWARLHQIGNQKAMWIDHARAGLDYLERVQVYRAHHPNDGGFAGSRPIWGPYMRFRYPNWAVKFYLDGVIACAQLMDQEAWG